MPPDADSVRRIGRPWRGNLYGVGWFSTWPHVSIGISAHLGSRFAHLSLHLPVGVVIIGCLGAAPDDVADVPILEGGGGERPRWTCPNCAALKFDDQMLMLEHAIECDGSFDAST